MGAFAEFEREIIRERQKEGIAIARAAGKFSKERQKKLSPEEVNEVREQAAFGTAKAELARAYGRERPGVLFTRDRAWIQNELVRAGRLRQGGAAEPRVG